MVLLCSGRRCGGMGHATSPVCQPAAMACDPFPLAHCCHGINACPSDAVLNRGVVLEALGRFEEAAQDYRAVLAVAPEDPAAW